jgi:hypothetical protein
MNATEIIERDVQSDGVFHVRQRLAVGVREPRKPAQVHPYVEVRSLDMRRGNPARLFMHNESKKASKNFVRVKHKSSLAWKELIGAAEKRLLRHQVMGEEMGAALRLFKRMAEQGEPFPGLGALGLVGAGVQELDRKERTNG